MPIDYIKWMRIERRLALIEKDVNDIRAIAREGIKCMDCCNGDKDDGYICSACLADRH